MKTKLYSDGNNFIFAFLDDEPNQVIGIRIPGYKENRIISVHAAIQIAKFLLEAVCDYRIERLINSKSLG
jgi:hypothetical protein